jgi:hypothetical protein
MKIEQKKWSVASEWETLRNDGFSSIESNLVIVFGDRALISKDSFFEEIKIWYPNAQIIINSTSGEIIDVQVNEETVSLTAIKFEKTVIISSGINIQNFENSTMAGKALADSFEKEGLASLLVISDGQLVNGSELVAGIESCIGKDVIITGGLAGDGANFQQTAVGLNEVPFEGNIIAIGFYGNSIKIGHGSVGGWDPFGPERLVTKSDGNILFELDSQPALDIYKKYLGEYSVDLPGSGLLFPLSVKINENEEPVVRTILAINEDEKSLTFAGNIPQGTIARMMKTNFERIIEGASHAAENTIKTLSKPELAILISCVGRKLVLNQRIEEEVEAVRETLGKTTAITGFYSYGEISPITGMDRCELHNQTMTITTMTEE